MNRLIYLIPLASFPLLAIAEQGPDSSMKTDNPYVAAALILVVCLSVAVGLAGYFDFRKRGLVACGVVFGMIDWLVTGPICMSAGVSGAISLAIASASAVLLAFTIIRFGERLASFFARRHAGRAEYDPDRD
jgi:uncharacterized membrane protein (UPF0136 family)